MVRRDEPPARPRDARDDRRGPTETVFATIETAAGIVSPNPVFRRRLHYVLATWLARGVDDFPRLRSSTYEKVLKRLKRDAQRLLDDLSRAGEEGEEGWAYENAVMATMGPNQWDILDENLRTMVRGLDDNLDALQTSQGGRPANAELALRIEELANVYEEFAQKRPAVSFGPTQDKLGYRGPFFRFTKTVIHWFQQDDQLPSDAALGKAIQRQLRRRRKRSDMDKI